VLLRRDVADPVALGLPGLGEQDQRRGVGRLGREREVEQDEGVRVPMEADGGRVGGDPQRDDERLPDDEPRRAEGPGEALGEDAEAVVAERPVMGPAVRSV
jgi:hypothetical protein